MWIDSLLTAWLFLTLGAWWPVWFRRNKPPSPHVEIPTSSSGISIIIPFRNEARRLPDLLRSIQRACTENIPVELIFVNDDSTDSSPHLVENFSAPCPHILLHSYARGPSPKKEALWTGIRHAQYPTIITWDADIVIPPTYFHDIFQVLQNHSQAPMIIAPVGMISPEKPSWLAGFQQAENLYLQAITRLSAMAGHPLMCNGAHLIFRKDAFLAVNGYRDLPPAAGGDDMFLMIKIKQRFPHQISYAGSALITVRTYPVKTWLHWWRQRLRWSRKNTLLADMDIRMAGLWQMLVYAGYFLALTRPAFWWAGNLILWTAALLIIHSEAQRRNENLPVRYQWFWLLLSPWLYTAVNLAALWPVRFRWKERTFRQ